MSDSATESDGEIAETTLAEATEPSFQPQVQHHAGRFCRARFDARSREALTYLVPFSLRHFALSFLVPLYLSAPSFCARAAAFEMPRVGAARALRLIDAAGRPLQGSMSEARWEERGGGLFFTRFWGGTRNIWRAFPDPQDAGRYPAWRALPVTHLSPPRYAAQPVPLPDARALVCVSNVLGSAGNAQIARFDLISSSWTALSDAARAYGEPAANATRVAFSGAQNARTGIYLAPLRGASVILPAIGPDLSAARHAVWVDANTLLIESVPPAPRGLYFVGLWAGAPRQLIVSGGGEAQMLGQSGLVFAAKSAIDAPPQLFLVARDGSGLRVLDGTRGARRPAPSPDGQLIAFDAPANAAPGAPRALWVLPLLPPQTAAMPLSGARPLPGAMPPLVADPAESEPEAPQAQLSEARADAEGVSILGTLRGPKDAVATLEFGRGEKPRRWEVLPAPFPPTSPLLEGGERVLARWNPPPGARGIWTLRLSLSGMGGASQSVLRVRLPLPVQAVVAAPPAASDAPKPTSPASATLAPGTGAPASREEPLMLAPEDQAILGELAPSGAAPQSDPIFPLPVPPAPTSPAANPTPATIPAPLPAPAPAPAVPPRPRDIPPRLPPFAVPPFAVPPAQTSPKTDSPKPFGNVPNSGDTAPPASEPPVATPAANRDSSAPANATAPANASAPANAPVFAGDFDVAGTPARVAPGEKISVNFTARNSGSAVWQTGSSGANRVRLVARWVDFSTGTRRAWNYFWLPATVAPDGRTQRDFEFTAPARAGKYKLIFGLVTLPANGDYKPPAWSAPQDAWDDEFAAIAFAVEVAAP